MDETTKPKLTRGDERRQSARLPCEGATCQFGEVRDLSRTGARVVCKKPIDLPEGACTHLKISAYGATLVLAARAANARKRGDGRYDVGFVFVSMTPELTKQLVQFAMSTMPKPDLGLRRSA
jgi:hypothetical protein